MLQTAARRVFGVTGSKQFNSLGIFVILKESRIF